MNEESLGQITDAEIVEIEKEIQEKKNELMLSESGEIEAQTINQLASSVAAYKKAGLIPKHLETTAHAVGAILFCKQIGVPPLVGMGQVALIHGKFTAYGSLFTALAQKDPDFGYDEVFYLDENQERICADNKNLKNPAWACIVRTQKKGSKFINEFSFTMDEAKEAGIVRNVWKIYPKSMLFWKAITRSYRSTYPAALNSILCYEDLKTDWVSSDVTPKTTDLNSL